MEGACAPLPTVTLLGCGRHVKHPPSISPQLYLTNTMSRSRPIYRPLLQTLTLRPTPTSRQQYICTHCLHHLRPLRKPTPLLRQQPHRAQSSNPADTDPAFKSILDNPPVLIRANRKHHALGLLLLAAIPATAFILGCWQVQRLSWKSALIAKFEDRLVREPLPLPPQIDPDAIKDFDYRRVWARGRFRHEQEMLIGPRTHDGKDGYLVVTPLDRSASFPPSSTSSTKESNTTILINRGWIPKSLAPKSLRPASLTQHEVIIEGLLRTPWKKNSFTPANKPAESAWYFPDVHEMAAHVGSQAVWVEETMRPDLLAAYDREAKGVPIGRAAEVNLRNNHAQYVLSLFLLT